MQLKNQLDDVVPSIYIITFLYQGLTYIFRFHLIILYLFIYSHECKGKVHVTWYISNYLPGYLNTSYIPYIVHTYLSSYLPTYYTSVAGSSICLCRRQQFYMWDHASLLNCTLWGLFVVLLVLQKQAAVER